MKSAEITQVHKNHVQVKESTGFLKDYFKISEGWYCIQIHQMYPENYAICHCLDSIVKNATKYYAEANKLPGLLHTK